MARKKIIVGNWKMNPATYEEAKETIDTLKRKVGTYTKVTTVVCVPSLFLIPLSKSMKTPVPALGAQNVSVERGTGSFTGELSAEQLYKAGARYSIVGHSERRARGETDEELRKKVQAVLDKKTKVILCIGEKERDTDGAYLGYIAKQITSALYGAPEGTAKNILIAYEPVWAIGASSALSSHDMHQMSLFIRKVLLDIFSEKEAHSIPVLYGGSVDDTNTVDILKEGRVDGLLVGRASLVPETFLAIIKHADSIK